ncbi:MAG: hypothetical protein ACR2G2_13845 [Pseudonocardia sp.]
MLVLDSGGVSFLAERSPRAALMLTRLRQDRLWPPTVPSAVLVECLTGHAGRDTPTNRLLRACEIEDRLGVELARRAAALRGLAGRGSAVDAVVVAVAEPGGAVLTSDADDLEALAANARAVRIITI